MQFFFINIYYNNKLNHNKNVVAHWEFTDYDDMVDRMRKSKKWLCATDSYENAVAL
eukprot:SAG11_NODE_16835_length_536_cov_0.826087_1_plen_55_part_10